jgi:hypothetical protein
MVKLVAVDVAQLDAVVDFLATFPEEQRDRAYWRSRLRHWWDLNPSFPEKPVRGWALAAGEKIYGFWGAVPQKYQVGGGEVTALAMSTWRVSSEARNQSLQLLNAFVRETERSFSVNTTANEVVRKTLRAFRFQEAATCPDGKTSYLFGRGDHKAVRLLAPLLNLPSSLLGGGEATFEAREIGPASADIIDRFWEKTKSRFPIVLRRDASFYRWFCFSEEILPKRVYGLFQGDELAAVLCFCQRNWSGRRELELLDFWPPPSDEAVPAMLICARRLAKEWRCDLIQIPHFSESLAGALRRRGVWYRKENRRRHFFQGGGLGGLSLECRSGLEGDWAL